MFLCLFVCLRLCLCLCLGIYANLDHTSAQKSRTATSTPLEPLIATLLKSFTDDSDLSSKLKALYTVSPALRVEHIFFA